MWNQLWGEIAAEHHVVPPPAERVTEPELAALPAAARAYFAFFGVVPGVAKQWSFAVGWTGRFRLALRSAWLRIEAVQYNTREPVARFFHLRGRLAHVLPMFGRDTYLAGRGHMIGKVAGLFTLVDTTGIELDLGELVTWVDDAVLFAPTMLLGPRTLWRDAGDRAFALTVTDRDRTVSARVVVDDRGAPIDFDTHDRFVEDPEARQLVRARWTAPVSGWHQVDGHPQPAGVRAIWHLPAGELCYADVEVVPGSVAYDLAPPATSHAA